MIEIFLPEADEEFREAALYYEDKSQGLGLAFLSQIKKTITRIRDNPQAASSVGSGVRRKLVPRFPYQIFYAIEGEVLILLAVAHQKRRPNFWKSRIKTMGAP
jgi:toxin ParE1/3/4